MNLDTTEFNTYTVILLIACITLITRWGGVFAMSFVPMNVRVQQFITAMSGSVLVALITPMAIGGDVGARAALLLTGITMLLIKKPLPAITVGIITAAFLRQF